MQFVQKQTTLRSRSRGFHLVTDEILQNINETFQGFLDADIVAYWQEVKTQLNKL